MGYTDLTVKEDKLSLKGKLLLIIGSCMIIYTMFFTGPDSILFLPCTILSFWIIKEAISNIKKEKE
jgi:hypothetical protein